MGIFSRIALTALLASIVSVAHAQPIVVADSGDSAWVMAASVIALLALPGMMLLRGRSIEGEIGTAMMVSAAVASLVFAVVGYSLAFEEGSPVIGGTGNLLLGNMVTLHPNLTISDTVYAIFELSLLIFAVGLLVSSIADRTRRLWLAAFVTLWTLMVYAPVAHWVWGGGWLSELGVLDYGGGLVVQITAGTAALVLTLLVGRKAEAGNTDDSRSPFGLPLVWVGWIAIMGGAAFGAGDDAATAMLNTHFAGSAAALAGLAIAHWSKDAGGKYRYETSAIAGLAAAGSGAAYVGSGGAIALGIMGAIAAWAGSTLLARLKVGTTANAFVSSGCGGIIGTLAFPVFVSTSFGGPGFDEDAGLTTQLIAQGVGVVAVLLWSAVATAIAALITSVVIPLRVRDSSANHHETG